MKTVSFYFFFLVLLNFSISEIQGQNTENQKKDNDSIAITKYIAEEKKKLTKSSAENTLLALKNVTVIDGTGSEPLPKQTIFIENGVIMDIEDSNSAKLPQGIKTIDLQGKYVIPGLIDSHVHLATFPSGVDNRTENENRLKKALYEGITSVRDMGGDARVLGSLSRDAQLNDIISPDIYYSAVMSGDPFTRDFFRIAATGPEAFGKAPWLRRVTEESDIEQIIAEAKGTGATGIKMRKNLSPELVENLTEEAHRQGMQVWAHGHVDPTSPKEILAAGVDGVSHYNTIWATALQKMPGNLMELLNDGEIEKLPMKELATNTPPLEEIFQLMKDQNIVFDPTLWISEYSTAYREEYRRVACTYIRKAEEMRIPHSTGTDQMNPSKKKIPLIKAIQMKVNVCGLTPLQAIRSATLYGAMAIGNETTEGSLESGKKANLVVLSSDPTEEIENIKDIEFVIKNGIMHVPN